MILELTKADLDVAFVVFAAYHKFENLKGQSAIAQWEYCLSRVIDGSSNPTHSVSGQCRAAVLEARQWRVRGGG